MVGFARRLPAPARLATPPLAGDKPQRYWKQLFSYQSFMPAAAGTPRYENWVHWLMEGFRCRLCPPPTPGWGQAPALHFSFDPGLSLFGRRWSVSPAGAGIHPGSESGTCFPTNDQSGKWWDSREGCRHPPGWPRLPALGTSPSATGNSYFRTNR